MLSPIEFAYMLTYFDKKYETLGFGKTRVVFAGESGQDVIKVPYAMQSTFANHQELTPSAWLGGAEYCAKTWKDDEYTRRFGILIIRMERLRLPERGVELPGWTMAVDCAQVGYNSRGTLVAYDWGD